jgi:hexose-6-phosphate dehydrogenase
LQNILIATSSYNYSNLPNLFKHEGHIIFNLKVHLFIMEYKFAVVALILLISILSTVTADERKPAVNVVLVGALGDLSKKYLFQAFSRVDTLRYSGPQPELILWPGSRSKTEDGRKAMKDILKEHLVCKQGVDFILPGEEQQCTGNQEQFKARVMPYMQLKYDEHYQQLDDVIDANNAEKNYKEVGRLIYLSIPPKAYRNVSRSIAAHVRPQAEGADALNSDGINPWLRVVFEKPFGSDENSAINLAEGIGESLEENEIYRIDHYLGKAGVQVIYDFRVQNKDTYEYLLTKEHVAYVDVVMKEKTDCAGRAGYYDDYGVVRDLHQNHLSEMMALAMMDLVEVAETNEIPHKEMKNHMMSMHKSYFYDDIQPPTMADVVVGQYKDYQKHVEQDRAKWMKDVEQIKQRTVTPTYASVRLQLTSVRWKNVPLYVSSGKAMEEREAYVRFVFKNKEELVFNVQGGKKGTQVYATDGLPSFNVPEGWRSNIPGKDVRSIVPNENPGAYDNLVSKVWEGDMSHFVATDTLLSSWRLWTPLLKELDGQEVPPSIYNQGGAEMYDASLSKYETVVGRLDQLKSSDL